jgi:hypothetical protein
MPAVTEGKVQAGRAPFRPRQADRLPTPAHHLAGMLTQISPTLPLKYNLGTGACREAGCSCREWVDSGDGVHCGTCFHLYMVHR